MEGLWKHNVWYSLLRKYVDPCTKASFRKIEIHGRENLPKDGVYIIAPNHCGALLDAMVTLLIRRGPTVFGARADIFDNPFVARILNFLRIIPMVRRRDGIRKVLRNYETIQSATDVLCNGVPFCIYSEGTHRPMHSLMPITKGIFRVACSATEQIGDKKVYVVPVGIEYEDYFNYRGTALVSIGEPMDFTAFLRERNGTGEADMFLEFRDLLAEKIAGQISWLPDDEFYEERWAKVLTASGGFRGTLHEKMLNRKAIAARVIAGEDVPDAKVRDCRFGKLLLAVLTAPFFAAAAVLSLPMWLTAELICRKIKDRAFHNTCRFGCKFAGTLIFAIIVAALGYCLLPWQAATVILLYFIHSYSIFYDYLRLVRSI